ncbi:hypothetical protein Tco_0294128 [Tanacetum coccineum]
MLLGSFLFGFEKLSQPTVGIKEALVLETHDCFDLVVNTRSGNSNEYMEALGHAFGRAIEKGMQEGLAAGIEHGQAGRCLTDLEAYIPSAEDDFNSAIRDLRDLNFPLLQELSNKKDASTWDIMDLLRLDDAVAETLGMTDLQPDVSQLMVPVHHKQDRVVIGSQALSVALDICRGRVEKMERNLIERLPFLKDVFVSIDDPLSAEALIEPPVEVPATNVLSTVVIVPHTDPSVSVEDYDNPDSADVVPENATLGSESEGKIDASARGGLTSQLSSVFYTACMASDTGAAPNTTYTVIPKQCYPNIKLLILKKEEYDILGNGISTGKGCIVSKVLSQLLLQKFKLLKKRGDRGKLRNILMMAIPKEHMRRFHGMDDTKEIWGSHQKLLLSQLEAHGAEVSTEDANHKFLRSLPPACKKIQDLDVVRILKKMDINWQIAMIAIRMKKFYKKTGRRVRVDGKTPQRGQCGKKKRDSLYQIQETRKQEKNQMGLLTMDDGIVNWGEHTEAEETNHALMAISSSNEVTLCSKTCIDSYNTLKTLCDEQMNQLENGRELGKEGCINTGNGVTKPVWTNANRINHSNKFVPRSVQLNAGRPKFNSVRPNINTGRTNISPGRPKVNTVSPKVNTVRPRQTSTHKTSNSLIGDLLTVNANGLMSEPSLRRNEYLRETDSLIHVYDTSMKNMVE